MKLFLVGTTGRTGPEIVRRALTRNDELIAYARNPPKSNTDSPELTVIKGQLDDAAKMASEMKGYNAVSVTPGNPISNSSGKLFSFAIPDIIKAMDQARIKRLISLSALGIGTTLANISYPYYMGAKGFLKGNFSDHEAGESQLKNFDLNWTTVHPDLLFNGRKTENPLIRDADSGYEMPGAPRTYRSDIAQAMLRITKDRKTFGKQLIMYSEQGKQPSLILIPIGTFLILEGEKSTSN